MRWEIAARVVFTVALLASGLFISNNSLKPDDALAQSTQPIRILTDNLTFSVVGSGVTSATQAKISYQTQKVYVNGIKLQNTTAFPQSFNLNVSFDLDHNGSGAGLIDIPLVGAYSGYDGCGGYRAFSGTLNANQTLVIPNNRACADIFYANNQLISGTTNTKFQWAATREWNSADLIMRLANTSNTATVPNALIWPAAKITVTDISTNSGANCQGIVTSYCFSLRLPDGSTRGSLGNILYSGGGATQSFGGALLDAPGQETKYTISMNISNNTANEVPLGTFTATDYSMYEETVSATSLNVQLSASPATITAGQGSTLSWTSSNAQSLTIDNGVGSVAVPSGSKIVTPARTTTYVITARGQTGVTATANAKVTVGLPDFT